MTKFKLEILTIFRHLHFKWLATGSLEVSLSMFDMYMLEIVIKVLLCLKRKQKSNSFNREES